MASVLAIAAHPDDIEFVMAGTLLRLAEAGYELHYCNLADGCCGSATMSREETARVRAEEARAAAASLGAVFHESLCHDLEVFYNRELLARVTSIVRQAKPRIVLTHALSDYMEDHMNAARLAVSGVFCRAMPNFPVEPPREPVSGPVTLYHAQPHGNVDPLGHKVRPEWFVDVTDFMERTAAVLGCHVSQKEWLDESQGFDSYIETMRTLNAEVGAMSGRFALAEGWRRHVHLGMCEPNDDPLLEALGPHAVRL